MFPGCFDRWYRISGIRCWISLFRRARFFDLRRNAPAFPLNTGKERDSESHEIWKTSRLSPGFIAPPHAAGMALAAVHAITLAGLSTRLPYDAPSPTPVPSVAPRESRDAHSVVR